MILYPSEYSVIDGYDESVPGHYKQVHLSPEIENLTKSYPFKSSVANNSGLSPVLFAKTCIVVSGNLPPGGVLS